MVVSRLMRLEEHPDGLFVVVHCEGLPLSEYTLDPLKKIYADVPQMLDRLLSLRNTSYELSAKARGIIAL